MRWSSASSAQGGDARAKLRRAGALTFSDWLLPIDLAVREWSRRDPTVAERLQRVDNRRMDYLRSLFGAFCPDEADVEARSMLAFSLLIGNHFMAADHGGRSRAGRAGAGGEAAHGLILSEPSSPCPSA